MTQIGEAQMADQQAAAGGDPYDAAMASEYVPPSYSYFGRLAVGLREIVLERGVRGGVTYDPKIHQDGQQRLRIELSLTPVDPARQNVTRDMLATDRQWVEIVRPSLVAAGTDLRRANGAWVEMTLVPDGRKYTDRVTQQERQSTTLKLLRAFPDEASCLDAYRANQAGLAAAGAGTGQPAGGQAAAPAPSAGAAPSRQTAARFLPAVWEQAGHDVARMEELMRANAVLAAHFTIDSPEVLAVIAGPPADASAPAQPPAIQPSSNRA